jgi:hypothetical protein
MRKWVKAVTTPASPEEAKRQQERWDALSPDERERLVPSDPEQGEIVSKGKDDGKAAEQSKP